MLNYRNTSIVIILISGIFFGAGLYNFTETVFIYLIFLFSYILLLIFGASVIQFDFFLKAYNRGNPDISKVSLTFDDGPDEQTTPEILNILKKFEIKAAFFCIGSKVEKNKTLLKRMKDEGHLIGNHTWSHSFFFDFYSPDKMIEEIRKTDEAIEKVTGLKVKLFRPPYGVTNPFVARALKKTGHKVIGWSLKTFDTTKNETQILDKLENKLRNGDIVLLHDTNKRVVNILESAIELIQNSGKEIVGLDELFSIDELETKV